jgi:conserved oligomeric Golgi complex subunit 7
MSSDRLMSPSSAPASNNAAGSLEEKLSQLLTADSQFSVAAYLNLALQQETASSASSSNSTEDSLQSRMAELALQLQFQTQACHDDIGRIGAELQAILPRCAADVSRVGVGLEGMRVDAQILLEQTKMDEQEQELSSSLASLSTLHALQSNLTTAKQVLTAAATWDSTMASIPPLLGQQKLSEAVHALAQLEHGEKALRGMPHREDRQLAISKVRQQVQTLLHPQLMQALQNMNTRLAPLQQCVSLFEKLNKMDSLREQYVKARPGALHKAWFAFSPSYTADGDRNPTGTDFSEWLPTWYDTVLQLLTEERRQATTVFGAESAPDLIVQVRH